MGEAVIIEDYTGLQKKVVSYGKQSKVGWAVLGVLFGLIGIAMAVFALLLVDMKSSDTDSINLYQFLFCMYLICFSFCIFGYVFGKYLKKAAEKRDAKKLESLFIIWIVTDIVSLILLLIIVIFLNQFQFLFILICAALDAYRLHVIWKFIQECKSAAAYSA